jgi:glycosidase
VPDFWADFRQVTRRVRPDCWTFGEVVEPPAAQIKFAGGLDGCLDFNLMEAFRSSFAYGEWNAERFMSFLSRHEAFFPEDFSRPSFLDNHDMNRFLWAANGDFRRLILAALCQFTLSAPPVIYYGTEVGLSQERDVRQGGYGLPEESRLPMLWGSSPD